MVKKNIFTVTQPLMLIWLSLILIGFFLGALVIDTFASGSLNIAIVILCSIIIFIPCTIIILWVVFFRIKVEGTTISVRRFFGLINYSFDVTDIALVTCKTVQNQMGQNQNIKLYTSTGKKVPVETLMINSEEMIKFIEENVDETKFRRSFKSFI